MISTYGRYPSETRRKASGARVLDVAVAESPIWSASITIWPRFAELPKTQADLQKVLLSPAMSAHRKAAIVRVLSARLGTSAIVSKLLELLATRHSFALLPDLAVECRRQVLESYGIVHGIVTTVIPLDESRARMIAERLGQTLGRTVRLECVVDPSIIVE